MDTWDEAFAAFHARFAPFFYRREVRERSARYLRGLLGPVERKNGWQLAEAVGETDPQGMQRLRYAARWDADAVRAELIPLSVPEARRLLEVALPLPARSPAARRAWSLWRRRHQAIARRCHYRRRSPGPAPPR